MVPETDDVVLIFEEKTPRQNWCLGRIIELLPSRDGEIRGAKVLIGKSKQVVERPVNKLYPIEFASEDRREVESKQIITSSENTVVNKGTDNSEIDNEYGRDEKQL